MIPKILHIQWIFDEWPVYGDEVVKRYAEANPGWDIRVTREIPQDIPDDLLVHLQNDHIPRACRADLVRYWSLYKDGGVYVDMDTLPLQPFGDAFDGMQAFTCRCNGRKGVSTRRAHGWIDCCLLGSEAGNPFWNAVFARCRRPQEWRQGNAWFAAHNTFGDCDAQGVSVLDDAVQEAENTEQLEFLRKQGKVNPSGEGFIIHYRMTPVLASMLGMENHWDAKTWIEVYNSYPEMTE